MRPPGWDLPGGTERDLLLYLESQYCWVPRNFRGAVGTVANIAILVYARHLAILHDRHSPQA